MTPVGGGGYYYHHIKYIVGNNKVSVASYISYDRYASAVTLAILEY
jgi:hypothetical protein